ncbi:cytochrome C oxidase subunit IV family protein [Natronolimnohabitans sp. A-GB9]|uniref:cytochrome C oxidase subunit IV family protein n=1 Tax=Natronolimnohabitans sp. A-GB9 TaxID=3069757 RepID=UPI0027B3EC36|nr:cytochrome C oxidase subunit IV family protein [Natronolimnohabitans sp. A-GB9]MDQ2049736.1 cytochrome C oxidase subunit IV family protein [Natronolimnohabitans sp. A-GB9]
MADVRTYSIIYVVLLVLGTAKFVFFELDQVFTEQMAITGTVILAVIKSLLIAGYYQHLREEPRSITYMMIVAVFMVFLLTVAAGYSIQ